MDTYTFYPSHLDLTTAHGTLVGYRLPGITLVVGAVDGDGAHTDGELDPALAQLGTIRDTPKLERLGSLAGRQLVNSDSSGPSRTLPEQAASSKANPSRPLHVFYDPPDPSKHHFLSLSPLELDVTASSSTGPARTTALDASESGSSLTRGREAARQHEGSLREVVRLINSAHSVARAIQAELDASPSPASVSTVSPPASSARSAETSSSLARQLRWLPVVLLRALHTRLPFGGPLPKDLSATINQIDVRAEQAAFLPTQLAVLSPTPPSLSTDPAALATSRARYINFYTTLWLIANDVIVGRALGLVLSEQSEPLGVAGARVIQRYTVDLPSETLRWLDAWPGGLKLNTDLSRFISSVFLSTISLWDSTVLAPLLPHLPRILTVIGLSGILGTTMALSLLSDLLSVLTAHLYVSYLLATVSFRWMRTMLGTLFNVFRGKRVNVLRNRLDANDYSVDQLLLGTVLFTLFAFLFPTVLVYYLFFAASRFLIIFGHAGLETCLAFMNHFPLFAVMLRLKDPARLPGGITLVPSPRSAPTHLRLKNQPIPLARIFFQHFALVSRLSAHYSPLRLIKKLAKGETIRPIERFKIRYDEGAAAG